jgi:GNAT superfamily N-acetyltransferase
MRQLRPQYDEDSLVARISEMRARYGYRLFARDQDGSIAALAGIGFGLNLYYGRYLWVYELITSEHSRSTGHGLALMRFLEDLARSEGCDTIALSSALYRADAHRFYEDKVGMDKNAYAFSMSVTPEDPPNPR